MRHLVTSHANGGRPIIDQPTRLYLVDALGTTRPQAYLATPAPVRPVRRDKAARFIVGAAGIITGSIAAAAAVIIGAMWVLTL